MKDELMPTIQCSPQIIQKWIEIKDIENRRNRWESHHCTKRSTQKCNNSRTKYMLNIQLKQFENFLEWQTPEVQGKFICVNSPESKS